MPRGVAELLDDGLSSISLNILVFGPQVRVPSPDVRTQNLQKKRVEIRDALIALGHNAKYAEELVNPALPDPTHNAFVQELVIMQEYDLIINLVESPGSIVEATQIAMRPALACKAALFLDAAFVDGLAGQACANAENIGAFFKPFQYPSDLTDCHLLGFVKERASKVQLMKYLG